MDVLPAGENGLVTKDAFSEFATSKIRPANSINQLSMYDNFIYGAPSVTDKSLNKYFLDESFGVQNNQVAETETPNKKVPVKIYIDKSGIPHIYGASLSAMAYGAGYIGAQDRLFFMDVLRHYGQGDLMSFVGNSCDYESMDYAAIMSKAYTQRDYQAQLNSLKTRFGQRGAQLLSMIDSYVKGVNLYISEALKNSSMMPFEYSALGLKPTYWKPTDEVAISTLIALEATGGGNEIQNSALLEYLDSRYGATNGMAIFNDMKEQNDPAAPTVISTRYPYMIPTSVNPALTALPDNAPTSLTGLTGAPPEFTANCTGGSSVQAQSSNGTNSNAFGNQINSATGSSAGPITSGGPPPTNPANSPGQSSSSPQALASSEVVNAVGSLSKLFSGRSDSASNAIVVSGMYRFTPFT